MLVSQFCNRFVYLLALCLGGCAFLTSGNPAKIQPVTQSPRVGEVAILRGLIGIWSLGLDDLSKKINAAGIQATVFQDDQWHVLAQTIVSNYRGAKNPEPLILMGHSYGADNAIGIARILNSCHMKVDLLITLDPVTPPRVPPNVKVVLNYYASRGLADNLPWWRGIPLKADADFRGALFNFDLAVNRPDLQVKDFSHAEIERDEKIHAEILQWLTETCPPRKKTPRSTERRARISAEDTLPSCDTVARFCANRKPNGE